LVTTESLQGIQKHHDNDEDWNGAMGYMDFITDKRNVAYNRRYVGQTGRAKRRIVREHFQMLINNSTLSIHYFIVWIGNGTRTANFIRLWVCPLDSDGLEDENAIKNWNEVRQSLLEALFCKAFRTHHGVLNRHETEQLQHISSYGLNLSSPLVPSGRKVNVQQARYFAEIESTPDSQIRFWAKEIRPKRKACEKNQQKEQLEPSSKMLNFDFNEALKASLNEVSSNDNLFKEIKDSFAQASPNLEGHLTGNIPYFGNRSAKIAFVLDFAVVAPEPDGLLEGIGPKEKEKSSKVDLPWALQGCQFDATNVLVWTFNFEAFSPLDKKHTYCLDSNVFDGHRRLLNHSNARIIIVSGPRAADALRFAFKGKRFFLRLRGFCYPLYVETSHSAQVSHRLFILCPGLPARIWSNGQGSGARLSEAIRFATSLLELKGLRPYSIETSSIAGSILEWARRERLGEKPMTQDNMDFDVKLWLARKGISEQTLKEIVGIAGSLPRGLLMIFYAIRKQPKTRQTTPLKRPHQPRAQPPRKKSRGVWDLSHLSEVEKIVSNAEEEFTQSSAQTSTSPLQQSEMPANENASSMANEEQDIASGITLLSGEEVVDHGTIEKIQYAMSHVHSSQETESIENSDTQDISLADLFLISREAIALRIPNRPKRTITRGWRKDSQRNAWKDEDAFREQEYLYVVNSNPPKGNLRLIRVNYCPISFGPGDDLGNGQVFVKIEISPPGERHPHCYATQASDIDPAKRLAFRLRYQPSSGPELQRYATDGSLKSVWKANTHVDMLLGKPLEEIACTPRRFVHQRGTNSDSYTHGTPAS
jgi:hypothetical protein